MSTDLSLQDRFRCSKCGELHYGVPLNFSLSAPFIVKEMNDAERENRVVIGSDQCIVDDSQFFVAGCLVIPIPEAHEALRLTVWAKVDEIIFNRMEAVWYEEGRENEKPYLGELANMISCYPDTRSLQVLIHTSRVGVRPLVEIADPKHILHDEQHYGVSIKRAIEIATHWMH